MEIKLVEDVKQQYNETVTEAQTDSRDTVEAIEQGLQINDQSDLEFAAEILKDIKGKKKDLEAQRKQATKPLNDALKVIRDWFRGPVDFYAKAEAVVKAKIAAYHQKQAQIRQRAIQEAGQAAVQDDRDTAIARMQEARGAEVSKVQGVSLSEVWDFEIVDVTQIPRSFLVVDAVKIRSHVRAQKERTNIPGVRAFKKQIVRSRS